eukprot:TRINITY_DN56008_c0_g1_i1.p1 TRINITY_DN56008_c0_g1~~TRINITY_DN56008_c0_g1_i1.p1  ORF type:complete len:328 (+),score=60.77 TRINITY_DN56008_c0_g1_i1:107-1090(+)
MYHQVLQALPVYDALPRGPVDCVAELPRAVPVAQLPVALPPQMSGQTNGLGPLPCAPVVPAQSQTRSLIPAPPQTSTGGTVDHCGAVCSHQVTTAVSAADAADWGMDEPPSVERPCEHNCWSDVRTRKSSKILRCSICSKKWKMPSAAVPRCIPFMRGHCQRGDGCTRLHVLRKTQQHSDCQPSCTEHTDIVSSATSIVCKAAPQTNGPVSTAAPVLPALAISTPSLQSSPSCPSPTSESSSTTGEEGIQGVSDATSPATYQLQPYAEAPRSDSFSGSTAGSRRSGTVAYLTSDGEVPVFVSSEEDDYCHPMTDEELDAHLRNCGFA